MCCNCNLTFKATATYNRNEWFVVLQVIYERPSLLGLKAGNVRTVVDYLQSRGDTQEMISEYLRKSI